MLTHQQGFVNPEIERLIKSIRDEDIRYDRELRSQHREKLVLPVSVLFTDGRQSINCFSRNISGSGICLLTQQTFEPNTTSILQIYRHEMPSDEIFAECKWCKKFGKQYWMTGWQFLRKNR